MAVTALDLALLNFKIIQVNVFDLLLTQQFIRIVQVIMGDVGGIYIE